MVDGVGVWEDGWAVAGFWDAEGFLGVMFALKIRLLGGVGVLQVDEVMATSFSDSARAPARTRLTGRGAGLLVLSLGAVVAGRCWRRRWWCRVGCSGFCWC